MEATRPFRDVFRRVYLPPLETPLYWGDEQSGFLRGAVIAYYRGEADREQMALVIEYCRYVIEAPCWADGQQYQGWQALPAPGEAPFDDAPTAAQWLYELTHVAGIDTDRTAFGQAYRRAAAVLHPDSGGDHERFVLLQQAKEILDRHHGGGA